MSLIKRNISARSSGHASGSVVNGSPTMHHDSTRERHRHGSTHPGRYTNSIYLPSSRRSGFGSRHSMFRVR